MPSITRQADDGIPLDRRGFLRHTGSGFGTLALAHMLGSETVQADDAPKHPPAPRPDLNGGLHHRAKAKRVVQMFMSGAASQCDTFDYKPELIKRHGQPFDPGGKVELFQSAPGAVHGKPVGVEAVRPVRQDGSAISLPHLADVRRRHGVHARDGLEVERPRPGHVHAEHRLRAARLSRAWAPGSATAWAA